MLGLAGPAALTVWSALLAWPATARLALLPLFLPSSSEAPKVYPDQGNGFAAYIVGGFFGLGVLVLFAVWTSRRPRRPS